MRCRQLPRTSLLLGGGSGRRQYLGYVHFCCLPTHKFTLHALIHTLYHIIVTGDFCPYIQTGENSGQYRHPHLALAALELWIANQCMPEKCAATWLDSPNGKDYAADSTKTTSITWAEMVDNDDPMSQPAVPYAWPNSGNGIYPGYDVLYPGDLESKDVDGVMTLPDVEYVESDEPVEGLRQFILSLIAFVWQLFFTQKKT